MILNNLWVKAPGRTLHRTDIEHVAKGYTGAIACSY